MYMVRTGMKTFLFRDSSTDYVEETSELETEGLIFNTLEEAAIAGKQSGYDYEVFKVKLNQVSPDKVEKALSDLTDRVVDLSPAQKMYIREYLEDTGY
jgi:hypothetical protein